SLPHGRGTPAPATPGDDRQAWPLGCAPYRWAVAATGFPERSHPPRRAQQSFAATEPRSNDLESRGMSQRLAGHSENKRDFRERLAALRSKAPGRLVLGAVRELGR